MTVIIYPNNSVTLRDNNGIRVNREDWTLIQLDEYLEKFCEFVDVAKDRKGDLDNPVHINLPNHEVIVYNNIGYTEEELVEIRRQRVLEYTEFCKKERRRDAIKGRVASTVGKAEKLVSMATEIAENNGGTVTIDELMKYMWSINAVLDGRKKNVRGCIEGRLKTHRCKIEKIATNTYRLKDFS